MQKTTSTEDTLAASLFPVSLENQQLIPSVASAVSGSPVDSQYVPYAFLIKISFFLFFVMCEYLHVQMCRACVLVPSEARKGVGALRAAVTVTCEVSHVGAGN